MRRSKRANPRRTTLPSVTEADLTPVDATVPSGELAPTPDANGERTDEPYLEWKSAQLQSLEAIEAKGQDDYDKTIIWFSGGALVLSVAFVKDIVGPHHMQAPYCLYYAWLCWVLSLLSALLSFFLTVATARRYREDFIDSKSITFTPKVKAYRTATWVCNLTSLILVIVGVVLMGIFIMNNSYTPLIPTGGTP